MDRGGGTDLRTVNRTVNSTGIGSEGEGGAKGQRCPGKEATWRAGNTQGYYLDH